MSTLELNPVSYVVLGLVGRDGPTTPYELKQAVGRGIANFWPFPHSQIYAETERLARLGLLVEEREQAGRRRRTYRITPRGRAALQAWLAEPATEMPQVRSLALLQLYFGHFASPEDLAALARAQIEVHQRRRALAEQIVERLQPRGDLRWQRAVAEAFVAAEQVMAEQWRRIEQLARERPDQAAAGER
jgi:PadR family transcriptional regulator, regulatory protein AphA